MAEWHQAELEQALLSRGWTVLRVDPGDEYAVAGSWLLGRGERRLTLDFDGLDDLETLPLSDAYAVHVRGRGQDASLYFGKKPSAAHPNRSWEQDLDVFVSALDDLMAGPGLEEHS